MRNRCDLVQVSLIAALLLMATSRCLWAQEQAGKREEGEKIDFAHDVAPILKSRCGECHTNGTYKGDLSLDTGAALLKSKAVTPGKSAASELMRRVTSTDPDVRMPSKGKPLPAKEIAVLRRWIDQGLPWQEGFSFKDRKYAAPLALRKVELPPQQGGHAHPLDRILDAYWARRGVAPPTAVDDATFLRRAHLDIVGLLPNAEEREAFLADRSADKRQRLVERLLADDRAYAEHWLTFWNDLLRNDYAGTGYIDGGRKQITGWLYTSLLANKPYDQFVRELIDPSPESEGFINGIKWRGRVNASQVQEIQFAQNVGQVFLGINLKCASCHDSFIDDWKLDDSYGLAAVVSNRPLEIHRCDVPTGRIAQAKFLWPELGTIDPKQPRQQRLKACAELLTSRENGRFARTIVNRLWHRLMGRGIVQPVDVMAGEPWDGDLLEYLAQHLVENGYDLKKTIALIATSEAYQAASVGPADENAGDAFVFRGPIARRMTAEQFLDAVWRVTGTAPGKPAVDFGDRRGEPVRASLVVADALMRSLGRPNREQVVTTRPDELTTLEALDLSNGRILAETLDRGAANLLREHPGWTAEDAVTFLYLSMLCREPTEGERAIATEIAGSPVSRAGLADLLWSLLMLPEFQLIR